MMAPMIRHRGLLLGGGVVGLVCLLVVYAVVRAVNGTPDSPKEIGVYMSGNNAGLDAFTADWSVQPKIASFYLGWDTTEPDLLKTYAAQGRTLQISLSTKSTDGHYVLWNDIAAGTYDAHIVSTIKSLDALGVTVLLALDVEPDGQYDAQSDASGGSPGVAPGQTPAQYVAAADHFADLIHANSTHVQSLVWLAGFQDAATSASFLPAHSKLDNIGWDPYKKGNHPVDETPTQLFATFIHDVLVPYGYGDIPRHIDETGIETGVWPSGGQFTSAQQMAFFRGVPDAMTADDIESVVWFRTDSGNFPYIPTDPAVDQAFASVVAQAS
jgi:hypothetical protein